VEPQKPLAEFLRHDVPQSRFAKRGNKKAAIDLGMHQDKNASKNQRHFSERRPTTDNLGKGETLSHAKET
jgi:hypothetical protein